MSENGTSNGHDPDFKKETDSNVVHFPKKEKGADKSPSKPPHEPFINLPLATKVLMTLIIVPHLIIWAGTTFISDITETFAVLTFSFIPGRFTGEVPFLFSTPLSVITYALLHGGWLHIGVNTLMLGALGAGFEKNYGTRMTYLVFFGSCVIAAGGHFVLDPSSTSPVVGASGGVSGLFGGLLLMLARRGQLGAGVDFKKAMLVFVGISIAFAFLGGPGGSLIAWAAHIGGFLGGAGLTYFLTRQRR